jgi:hypothetical protein
MTERKTPKQRITEFLNNSLPEISGKFPAFNTAAVTSDLGDMVQDVDLSGAEIVPPLDPESIQGGD